MFTYDAILFLIIFNLQFVVQEPYSFWTNDFPSTIMKMVGKRSRNKIFQKQNDKLMSFLI